ncbi:DinI-like family protein [Yersinia bercovieri]
MFGRYGSICLFRVEEILKNTWESADDWFQA